MRLPIIGVQPLTAHRHPRTCARSMPVHVDIMAGALSGHKGDRRFQADVRREAGK